jgi:peptidoglycan/LPS O-acetylase OafA/YrhL
MAVGVPHRRLDNIQYLRAIAALLVVLCHGAAELMHRESLFGNTILSFIKEKGLFGVDIFFIISGFIMYYISVDKIGEKNILLNLYSIEHSVLSRCTGLLLL